ncbi:MAG: translocation/assembly module TamB domain-containing protein [Polyangiaceae bacterium]|nr:translocation/assembly module TamB domain-containing protein [Polyangiaceae bacterium]
MVVFLGAALGGAVLHLGTAPARRLLASALTQGLSGLFLGEVAVSRVDSVGLMQVAAADVVVRDPGGNAVLEIARLRVRANGPDIVRRVLLGTGKQTLVIDHVRADGVRCAVLTDATSGSPSIASAFTPAPSEGARTADSGRGPEIRVWVNRIEIGQGSVRGVFPGVGTLEGDVARVQGSVLATARGAAVDVERFGAVVRGIGGADARGTGELHVRAPGRMWSSFDGFVGDVGVSAQAELKGKVVEARVELPRAEAAAARAIWSGWPFLEDAGVHVEAHGELPSLAAQVEITVGRGRLRADGHLRLAGDVGVRADLEAQHLDLRSVIAGAPATDIGINTQLVLFEGDRGLTIKVNGITTPATISSVQFPATDVAGALVDGVFGGRATLHERGIPVKLDLDVTRDGTVELALHARSFRLQRAPRIAALTTADGFADVRIAGRLVATELDAKVEGTIDGFTLANVAARRARLTGSVRGRVTDPAALVVDLSVAASGVRAEGAEFAEVTVSAKGPVRRPHVSASLRDPHGPSLEFAGTVEPFGARAAQVRLAVARDGTRVEGELGGLSVGSGRVVVDGLKLRGAGGELTLHATLDERRVVVKSAGAHVDLAEVARLLGLPPGVVTGRLDHLDIDVDLDARSLHPSRGRVVLALNEVSAFGVERARVDLDAMLAGGHLDGRGSVGVPSLGAATLRCDTDLPGSPLAAEAWMGATGGVELFLAGMDLAELSVLLTPYLGEVAFGGRASGALRLSRIDAEVLPDVDATVATEGLVVRHGTDEYRGADLGVTSHIDGGTGRTGATVRVDTPEGVFARGAADIVLDLGALLLEPGRVVETFLAARGEATIDLPSRSLEALPEFVPALGLQGTVEGHLELAGLLGDPVAVMKLDAHQVHALTGPFQEALSGTVKLSVRPSTGDVKADAVVRHEGDQIAFVSAGVVVPFDEMLLSGLPALAGWTGKGTVRFAAVPLGIIPYLAGLGLEGPLRGTAEIRRTEGDPRVRADLEIRPLVVNGSNVGAAKLELAPTSDHLEFTVTLDEGARAPDTTSARVPPLVAGARAGLRWQVGVPRIDSSRPIEIDAQAESLDARVLMPFSRDVLTELSGRLDGMVHILLEAEPVAAVVPSADEARVPPPPGSTPGEGASSDGKAGDVSESSTGAEIASGPSANPALVWRTEVGGAIALDNGVLQLAGLGLEIQDAAFNARAQVIRGETVISVTDIEGRARSDTPNVKGWAELHIDGEGLAAGKGALNATEMPLPLGGVSLATVTGETSFEIARRHDEMRVAVGIERMVARLPLSATRSVLDTSDNSAITIAQPLREAQLPRPAGNAPWRIVFNLGRQVRVVYTEFEIPVSGRPELLLAEESRLSGYVDLEPGGRLPLLGKTFRVVNGRVWLDPKDAANPRFNVVASWSHPQATVYIHGRGRWNAPTLELESEPPYSEDQIFLLLLGGSLDDARGAQEGLQLQAAYGAAQALGVGHLFAGTVLSDIEVSPDTEDGATRYRASYRLSDRVRLEGIYQPDSGTTDTPGGHASSTSGALDESRRQDSFAAAVDLGLGKGWFLRTEAGNASAEADLLWQYRY